MSIQPRIFVSGMGVVSPIGIGLNPFWHSLQNGHTGITFDERLRGLGVPWEYSARIDDFDGKKLIKPRKALKVMCREIQFGYVAATMALEQATGMPLPEHGFDHDRLACVFGAETFHGEPEELASAILAAKRQDPVHLSSWGQVAMTQIQPLWMLKYLPNMAASHISIAVDARGPNNTICQGDVSSVLALIEGADLIVRNWADCAIVGGTSSRVSPLGMVYRGANDLAVPEPDKPFEFEPGSRRQFGTVHGEGAAALILESESSLKRRNGTATLELVGWARGFGNAQSRGFGNRIAEIAQQALASAGLHVRDLGHLNLNANGCPRDDEQEAGALSQLASSVPQIALKRFFGNPGPSSGMLEIVGSLLALQHGRLPVSTSHIESLGSGPFRLNPSSETAAGETFLKLAFAATGQVTAVVFRRGDIV